MHREMKIYFPEYKDALGKVDGAFSLELLKSAPFPADLKALRQMEYPEADYPGMERTQPGLRYNGLLRRLLKDRKQKQDKQFCE